MDAGRRPTINVSSFASGKTLQAFSPKKEQTNPEIH
jgi:hypothetical protein